MTSIRASSRYSSSSQPSPDLKNPSSNRMDTATKSRALVLARSGDVVPTQKRNPSANTNFVGTMVKKLMEKKSNNLRPNGPLPIAAAVEGNVKGKSKAASNLTNLLNRKLFHKTSSAPGGGGGGGGGGALTEVKANTRTLSMVLRSERELLFQNKDYQDQIQELRLVLDEKNREVEKLKDLCLKQREEIKALKDAILFPDVMNSQLHELLEKQGSELKQARNIIPCLQKQVSSLTGQLQCLAEDLAEVKADKYVERKCFDCPSSPQTPKSNQEAQNSLECSSGCPVTYGSPDEMFMKDLNPCLTPCFSKTKSKEYDQTSGYDFPSKNRSFENSAEFSPNFSSCCDGILSKSSEHCQRPRHCVSTARKIYKSNESKYSTGKPKLQNVF